MGIYSNSSSKSTHKVTHEFVSGTPGKELPQEVKVSKPTESNKLER